MPKIWTYSDPSNRGYGLFKRLLFHELAAMEWDTHIAEAPLLKTESKVVLWENYIKFQPDWLLLINQSASQFYDYLNIPFEMQPLPCKKIIWFLDNPKFFVKKRFEPDEFVFCFDETYMDWLNEWCPAPPKFLPLAADQSTPGHDDKKYACDISFVGGVIEQSARRSQLPPEMQHYVQRLVEEKLKQRSATFEELVVKYPISEGKQINPGGDVAHYLYWEANNLYRLRTLEALQDFDLHIYGNEDWEILLQNSPLLAKYKGKADPNTELPAIFASSQINLNIHSIQCMGSLNQRDFNAPICGGFLLSDWVPAAGRYFEAGKEAVYYSDLTNLRRKIDYFLHHEEERQQVIEAGMKRVKKDHTYKNRIHDVLQHLPV